MINVYGVIGPMGQQYFELALRSALESDYSSPVFIDL